MLLLMIYSYFLFSFKFGCKVTNYYRNGKIIMDFSEIGKLGSFDITIERQAHHYRVDKHEQLLKLRKQQSTSHHLRFFRA